MRAKKLLSIIAIGIFAHTSVSEAYTRISLRPGLEEEVINTKIGGEDVFSVGFYADSNVLLNKPYAIVNDTSTFSYQVPVGVGFEFALGWTKTWEIAASLGYQKFEAREIGAGKEENYVVAGFRSFPVRAILRKRWPDKRVAPEIEMAVGANFQTNNVKSSLLGQQSFSETRVSPYGHLGAGISYVWGIDLTIHFIAGYSAIMNGESSYNSTNFDVASNSLVHGFFSKGMVRYQF